MQTRLRCHLQKHLSSYRLLVIGSVAAAIVGAVAAIVYDHSGPYPWDVYLHDQQQAVKAAKAKAIQDANASTK